MHIVSFGSKHPDNIITNEFLENLGIDSVASWIVEKIGIRERRTVLPLDYIKTTKNIDFNEAINVATHTPEDLGVEAAKEAMSRANLKEEDIGMLIVNCCNPTQTIPGTAQNIAKKLELKTNKTMDVFSACPAFALLTDFIFKQRKENLPRHVMCMSTANLTTRVDYSNRSDSAIWGDGAAAWIIDTQEEGGLEILSTTFEADPRRSQAVVVKTFGHFEQDGRAVRDFSVRQTVRMIKKLEKDFGLDWEKNIFVGHQANGTMLTQICKNRKIPDSNHWSNVEFIGNQAGAGAPAVLAQNFKNISSHKGKHIGVAVLGAGLSWGSVLLKIK